MKIFRINKNMEIICRAERTRSGFRHLATLLVNGIEQEKSKCCYINRTWESYEFQSVMDILIDKALKNKAISKQEENICRKFIREGKQAKEEIKNQFKTISTIASLGDVFCKTQKEKNDWKLRMLKVGLENKGLDIPDDFDTLSEEEKTKRLEGALEVIRGD